MVIFSLSYARYFLPFATKNEVMKAFAFVEHVSLGKNNYGTGTAAFGVGHLFRKSLRRSNERTHGGFSPRMVDRFALSTAAPERAIYTFPSSEAAPVQGFCVHVPYKIVFVAVLNIIFFPSTLFEPCANESMPPQEQGTSYRPHVKTGAEKPAQLLVLSSSHLLPLPGFFFALFSTE